MFKDEPVAKPAILALNKIDIEGGQKKADELTEQITHLEGKFSCSFLLVIQILILLL